jgi:hypothetical protein
MFKNLFLVAMAGAVFLVTGGDSAMAKVAIVHDDPIYIDKLCPDQPSCAMPDVMLGSNCKFVKGKKIKVPRGCPKITSCPTLKCKPTKECPALDCPDPGPNCFYAGKLTAIGKCQKSCGKVMCFGGFAEDPVKPVNPKPIEVDLPVDNNPHCRPGYHRAGDMCMKDDGSEL